MDEDRYWDAVFARREREEEKWERSCLECDCGHLVPPDEHYFEYDGETYCDDCAHDLGELYDGEETFVCEYCGEEIDNEYESIEFDGKHFHEDCFDEWIDEMSEVFWGWD